MASRLKKQWVIEVWEGSDVLEERRLPLGALSESAMMRLLQMLVAKYSLEFNEIIDASIRKGSKDHRNLLVVDRNKMVDIYYLAVIIHLLLQELRIANRI